MGAPLLWVTLFAAFTSGVCLATGAWAQMSAYPKVRRMAPGNFIFAGVLAVIVIVNVVTEVTP